MGETATGMESTSKFAGMWRAEGSRSGGCCESRAMDRRGQESAAVKRSRWRFGNRAVNGCAMVPEGRGANVDLGQHGQGDGRNGADVVHEQRRWGLRGHTGQAAGAWGEGGGVKKLRQALKDWKLRHAERIVLPAVAQRRKEGVGGGRAGLVGRVGGACRLRGVAPVG